MSFDDIALLPEDPEELFEELGQAGTGNYAAVIKARNRVTDEIVAIKQILLTDKGELEAIQREVIILKKCNHPNVVGYRGAYKSLGKLWIVMEYCDGGSLDLVYKLLHCPLPEPLIALVARQVLLGLQYLHHRKCLHRDIKGSNVLLTLDGQVKLADFGVSTELSHTMSRRNTFTGTALWMAPEVIVETEYDDKADIWSLGITMIELAENGPPHLGMHLARLIYAIPRGDPPTLRYKDQWSPQMNVFIKRLLTKDKHLRPSADMMLTDPFVQPENIGTQEQLCAIIAEVMEARERLSPGRLMRGDFSSDTSTATFVARSTKVHSSSDCDDGGDCIGVPRQETQEEQQPAVAREDTFFVDGTIPPLPLLTTEDLSFDELCFSERQPTPTGVLGPKSVEKVYEMLTGLDSGTPADEWRPAESAGAEAPDYVMQVTHTLQSALEYMQSLPHIRGVSREEAARSQQVQAKYGTALRHIYRV